MIPLSKKPSQRSRTAAIIQMTAAQPRHAAFIYELFCGQCVVDLQLHNWPIEQQKTIMDIQFKAHEQHHQHAFSEKEDSIIIFHDIPVGRVILGLPEDRLVLADINLLPDYRGKGIAGMVIRQLQQRVKKEGKNLELNVYKSNPAVQIYEHLCFKPVRENKLMILMEWKPGLSKGNK